jgi:hypothetical protein
MPCLVTILVPGHKQTGYRAAKIFQPQTLPFGLELSLYHASEPSTKITCGYGIITNVDMVVTHYLFDDQLLNVARNSRRERLGIHITV